RGRTLGLLQQALRAGRGAERGAGAGRDPRRRSDLRPCHDQEMPPSGMGHVDRRGDRGRGPGAGHLHADQGLRPRLPGLRRQAETGLRRQLMADRSFLDWPFFAAGHRTVAAAFERWTAEDLPALLGTDADADVSGAVRRLVAALAKAGLLRHSAPNGDGPSGGLEVRNLCLAREILARASGLAD